MRAFVKSFVLAAMLGGAALDGSAPICQRSGNTWSRGKRRKIAIVTKRECRRFADPQCAQDLERQAQETLLVLLSGGLPFDMEILPRCTDLAAKAAQASTSTKFQN